MTWGMVLTGILVPATVSAEILVGVKAGDKAAYNIDYYGVAPSPPPSPYLIWREIEVLSVQGTTLTFDLTEKFSNRMQGTDTFTEDLETGVSEALIIPANLSNGDIFDHKGYGSITISGVEEKTYAWARRTIVNATVSDMKFYWDKTTGVLVELLFYNVFLEAYTHVEMVDTNMWQGEVSLPIDPTLFYVLIIVGVVIVVAVVFFVISRRKKRVSRRKKKVSRRKK